MRLSVILTRSRILLFGLCLAVAFSAMVLVVRQLQAAIEPRLYLPMALNVPAAPPPPPPNGRILYTLNLPGGETDTPILVSVEPDGSDMQPLTTLDDKIGFGRWSPDRQSIAFARREPGGGFPLGTMNADGSNIQLLAPSGVLSVDTVDWSHDGQGLVFDGGMVSGQWDILTIDPDGQNLTNLTEDLPGDARSPVWSPDGRILYSYNDGQQWDFWLMNTDGSNRTRLTNSAAVEAAPDWSPDGQTILFTGNTSIIDFTLYTMPATGGPAQFLLDDAAFGRWSPDGTEIVFVAGSGGISRADADGQNVVPVVTAPNAYQPDW